MGSENEEEYTPTRRRSGSSLLRIIRAVGRSDTFRRSKASDYVETTVQKKPLRTRLQSAILAGPWGRRIDVCSTAVSLLACILYIWETYLEEDELEKWFDSGFTAQLNSLPTGLVVIELIIAIYFVVDYVLFMYLARKKVRHFFEPMTLIDLVSIIPVIGVFYKPNSAAFLRFLRVFRAFRLLRAQRLLAMVADPVRRELLKLVFAVFSLLFIGTGLLEYLGKELWIRSATNPSTTVAYTAGNPFYFHDAFYFLVVTVTTVGYGDVSPVNDWARYAVLMLIVAGIIIIPRKISKLSEVTAARDPYGGSVKRQARAHVVVCGRVSSTNFINFYKEFFNYNTENDDSGMTNRKIVIMSKESPDMHLEEFIRVNESRVVFVRGSALNAEDLERVRMREAEACFVLVNQFTRTPDAEDRASMLRSLAVKKYAPELPVHMQLIRAVNLGYVKDAGIDHCVSLTEFKLSLISKSVFVPGASTFVNNLIIASAPAYARGGIFGLAKTQTVTFPWSEEYGAGIVNELYISDASHPSCLGHTFTAIVSWGKSAFGITVIGICKGDAETAGEDSCVLNPPHYTIEEGDRFIVIAESEAAAKLLSVQEFDPSVSLVRDNEPTTPVDASVVVHSGDVPEDEGSMDGESDAGAVDGDDADLALNPVDDDWDRSSQGGSATGSNSAIQSGRLAGFKNEHTIESGSEFSKHVVVIGSPLTMAPLLIPLREKWITPPPPVLVVSSKELDDSVWRSMVEYEHVYFLHGDPRRRDTLRKANIAQARSVIILSHRGNIAPEEEDLMVDSDAIFTTFAVQRHYGQHVQIITDLMFPENLRFLRENSTSQTEAETHADNSECARWPIVAAGKVWTSHTFDSLLVQTHYTPSIMTILAKMVAAGHMSFGENRADGDDESDRCQWFADPIPEEFVGSTFETLFRAELARGHVVMGLYRSAEAYSAPLPYVVSNPKDSLVLHFKDKMYVLRKAADAPPSASPVLRKPTHSRVGSKQLTVRTRVDETVHAGGNEIAGGHSNVNSVLVSIE